MTNKPKLGWDNLFARGVVIDVDYRSWGGRTALKASDLNIKDSEEVNKALHLGNIRLHPKEATEEMWDLAKRAKRMVDRLSLNFPFVRGARFVPDRNVDEVIVGLRDFAMRIRAAAGRYGEQYEDMQTEMERTIRQALLDATGDEVLVEDAMVRVMAAYPSKEDVIKRFSLTWTTYVVGGPRSNAVADAVEQETEAVKNVVQEMIQQLREEFTEKASGILKIVAKGGKIPSNSADAAFALLDRVETLNLFGDRVLTEQVYALRKVIRQNIDGDASSEVLTKDIEGIRDTIEQSMKQAVKEAEANLLGLGRRKIIPNGEVA